MFGRGGAGVRAQEDEDEDEDDDETSTAAAGEAPVTLASCAGVGRGFLMMRAMVSMVLPRPIISHRKPPRTSLVGGGASLSSFRMGL